MKRLLLGLTVIIFIFSFSIAALGATINIPADFATIQAGIENATDNDTVLVAPGTYVENINFLGKAVAVIGSSGASSTTLIPAAPDSYTIRVEETLIGGAELTGFTITGGGNCQTVRLVNARMIISNNIFANNVPFDASNKTVIQGNISPVTIERNVFYGNGGISCIGIGGTEAKIINNTFDSNNRGFYTTGEITIYNNIVTNSNEYGIHMSQANAEFTDYNCVFNNNPDYEGGMLPSVHDINQSPLFEGSENFDFHLTLQSPCIKAGNPDPIYNNSDGTRSDIGAFQFDYSLLQLPLIVGVNFSPEHYHHVVSNIPTINWDYFDIATTQAAYQIEVGTDNDWSSAELWNSGEVFSGDASTIYDGSALFDGNSYYGRIRVNNGMNWGQWTEFNFYMNTAPPVPILLSPLSGDTGYALRTSTVVDPDGDPVKYDYEVYSDEALTNLVLADIGFGDRHFVELDHLQTYWWRARANDSFEQSSFTQAESFVHFDLAFCCTGRRGNANYDKDDLTNIADITYIVSWLFGTPSGPSPVCIEEANANGDPSEAVGIADVTFLVKYLFGIPPGPAPGFCSD